MLTSQFTQPVQWNNIEINKHIINAELSDIKKYFNYVIGIYDKANCDDTMIATRDCLGYISDISSMYHNSKSECNPFFNAEDDDIACMADPHLTMKIKGISDDKILVIKEILERWNLKINMEVIDNCTYFHGPLHDIFKTSWKFQGILNLYRYLYFTDIPNNDLLNVKGSFDLTNEHVWSIKNMRAIWALSKKNIDDSLSFVKNLPDGKITWAHSQTIGIQHLSHYILQHVSKNSK